MKKLILLAFVLLHQSAFSASPFWLGAGTLTHNFLTAQNDEKGGTKVFDLAPVVFIGTNIPFFLNGVFFTPALGYAKFFTKDETTRSEIILQYHLTQPLLSSFMLHYGFSNYITSIGGNGGTLQLNNGSSTATFYTPTESKTTFTSSLDLGGEFIFTNEVSARAQVSIMRFLSSERRRVSHLITMNYFF